MVDGGLGLCMYMGMGELDGYMFYLYIKYGYKNIQGPEVLRIWALCSIMNISQMRGVQKCLTNKI